MLTEEREELRPGAELITIPEAKSIIRRDFWKIALFTLLAGGSAAALMFLKPDLYQASATITPIAEESKPNPALGALATFGIPVGTSSKSEELEALFRSDDLTVRVFRKHNLWPVVFGGKFEPSSGKLKFCWKDRVLFGREKSETPTDWDAIRAARKSLTVSANKKMGTLFIAFETIDRPGSSDIVRYYLEEAKGRLQEEALDRASRNKKFIEEQIGKTVDALTRDRLYSLYGQEVEREMVARNREQFGFKIIDGPRIPDRKSGPERAWNISIASLLAFLSGCLVTIVRGRQRSRTIP